MRKIEENVRTLRKREGFSQEQLAKLLDVNRSTITQMESGERKIYTDELIRLSEIFNVTLDYLVGLEEECQVVLEGGTREGRYVSGELRINVPQEKEDKFREVLIYILNKVGSKPNIGETVIYKLLYFIDFNFYEKYEEQLIGATYIRNHFGPTPKEFKKIVEQMIKEKLISKRTDNYYQYPVTKYEAKRRARLSLFRGHEIEEIDQVINRLSDMNAFQISEYSHNDVPWMTTKENEIIDYEAVFYRTPQYSVRDYVNE